MPIVNIDLGWLSTLLGQPYDPQVLRESLEQIGCDVEDIVQTARSRCPQCEAMVDHPHGQEDVKVCTLCGHESESPFRPTVWTEAIRLDLLADRPDLFDVGGLARALRGTLGIETGLPKYTSKPSGLTVKVDKSVLDKSSYRPFIACAVMTLPTVDDTSLPAIMKLQENLHWGVGRDRKLASIGVYDMSAIDGDITYRTIDPDKEPFTPLGMPGRKMTGRQILESHPKGVAYAELLAGHKRYPVLVDSKNQVLSMPPIINSDQTKLQQGTTRIFIDVTGISQAAVTKSLDTLVCSLAEIGGTIEIVTILDPDGKQRTTPDLAPRSTEVDLAEAKRWLGLPLDEQSLAAALRKMRFDVAAQGASGEARAKDLQNSRLAPRASKLTVAYPPYRTDIRHMVDLFEDVAIGYGYANIQPRLVRSMTVGTPRSEEVISDRVRQVLVGLGYSEIMSLPLTTEDHQFERLRIPVPAHYPQVANPKLKAYNVVRSHLMGGLLEALRENRRRPLPIRLFEIDNVAQLDDSAETGAAENRNLALVEIGRESGYATARSAIDALLRELGWPAEYAAIDHPTFVPGRAASISVNGKSVGILGEVRPEVFFENFGLTYPVALAEVTLQRVV
jgi:phenylalanyl-tRNA synthetase beta chain